MNGLDRGTSAPAYRLLALAALVTTAVLVWAPVALGQDGSDGLLDDGTIGFLGLVALCGAIGGCVYELTVLQGNVEWPHKAASEEAPDGGYPHARVRFLYDLGIFARLFVGAAAAVIVFWVVPVPDENVKLIAVAIVAGSAGIAIFRSVQDRLLALLKEAKSQMLQEGMMDVRGELAGLKDAMRAGGSGAEGALREPTAAADIQAKTAEIHGRVEAILKTARRL